MTPLDANALNDPTLPWQITVLEEVGSTSDWLRQRASEAKVGTVVFAEEQTAGRGRRENRWIAQRGKDLMFSMLLRPKAGMEKWPRITTLAALAICKAIEAELPLQPLIKWPNDIYVSDRKLCGLLAETVTTADGMRLVLGIGINVNSIDFPPDIPATSLLRELPSPALRELDRNALAQRLLEVLHDTFLCLDDDYSSAVAEVRTRSWLLGKQIRATLEEREIFGRVLDLNEEGHLILETADGQRQTLSSAENIRQIQSPK